MIYTFWEGPMPQYIEMCLRTWKLPYTMLNYSNVGEYTELPLKRLKRFTLPQIADVVRVHVLRDHGGYWLDADTIMIKGQLPETDMVGDPAKRTNTIGLLWSAPGSAMFKAWAAYQDKIINGEHTSLSWSLMGNEFTDDYVKAHREIRIHDVTDYWPETYMIQDGNRMDKYKRFYFDSAFTLADIRQTDLLMLHNSWTPHWYDLKHDCTLSNILKELLN